MLGHDYDIVYKKESTVFEEGDLVKKCQRKGCTRQYVDIIPKKTPDWGAIHERYGESNLGYGNNNNYVKNLQTDLDKAGIYTSSVIDGKYGSMTSQSVKKFVDKYDIDTINQSGGIVDDEIKMYLYYKIYK